MRTLCLIIFLLSTFFFGHAQVEESKKYPQNYFRSPVDIPIILAGNFAELRSNHFHAGIDIKTQGVEGKNIYAVADGWVSRIKIQHYGYGRVIYIDHPNGFTTVYAHLQSFKPKINERVRKEQYAKESYEIDIKYEKGVIPVSKSEVIAISGNSGGSTAPHLHFEIRDTESEIPINPLLFGFNITDTRAPSVYGVRIYPLSDSSLVNGHATPQYYSTVLLGNNYVIKGNPVINIQGPVGIGLNTIDRLNGAQNKCGIFKIEGFKDSIPFYTQKMEKVSFDESKYINSHSDYKFKRKHKIWIHKTFIDNNNQLSIYDLIENKGEIIFNDNKKHNISYTITDSYGNKSNLKLPLKQSDVKKLNNSKLKYDYILVNSDEEHHFEGLTSSVSLSSNSLYSDQPLIFNESKSSNPNCLGNVLTIFDEYTPFHERPKLGLKIDTSWHISSDHLMIGQVKKNSIIRYYKPEKRGQFMATDIRNGGSYCLIADTIPPSIVSLTITSGTNIGNTNYIYFKIHDSKSGIYSYRVTIDEQWVLSEYEYKRKRLKTEIPNHLSKGKHKIKIEVSDASNNKKEIIYSVFK